nr:hypothetical protein [Mycoplasmopsis bovis]
MKKVVFSWWNGFEKNPHQLLVGILLVDYLSRVKQKRIDHISLIFEIIFRTFALILITVMEALGISADKPFNFGFVFS